jgi:hypothetical protein
MNAHGGRIRLVLAAVIVGMFAPGVAAAQAWNYPAFQPPTTTSREFNFAIADGGDAGTSLVLQWREGVGVRTQIGVDAGFADADGGFTPFLIGGHLAYQMLRATVDMPLDVLFTGGVYAALEDDNVFRIPIGVVVGHRFPLEGRLAITPYVHPRLIIDFCDVCFGPDDDSDVGVGFDLGGSFEFSPRLAMRLALSLGGTDLFDDDNAFGLSLAWNPGRR